MQYLVFKTNIHTESHLQRMGDQLNEHPLVSDWSIDTEDVDNVLKIKPEGSLEESDVIEFVNSEGFHCESLPD